MNFTAGKILCILLCVCVTSAAQNDVAAVKEINSSNINNFKEKIFVHTDKTFYLAGERIWFKAYVCDAFSNMPLQFSSTVYLELLSPENKPVLQTKISTVETGSGSLQLPPTISTGTYLLRAYTNWMKNFDTRYFFTQPITIVNTINGISAGYGAVSGMQQPGITFYPEGGNLVEGLSSNIGVKAIGKNGLPKFCTGTIINDKKEKVAQFITDTLGIGTFLFTPQPQQTYVAVVSFETDTIRLPFKHQAVAEGYVIQLEFADDENELININVKASADYNNLPVYLLAQSSNGLSKTYTGVIKKGQTVFAINKNQLTDGVTHFTLLDNDRQLRCRRLYYKHGKNNSILHLRTDKQTYSTKEKVTIDINADTNSSISAASLSVSVFLIDSLQPLINTGIENYFLPVPGLNNYSSAIKNYTDKLMLSETGAEEYSTDTFNNKKQAYKYLPEAEGQLISGKITHTSSGLPASGITVYLSIPAKKFQFVNAISDSNGHIFFPVNNFSGTAEIVVQTNNTKDSGYTIEIDKPFLKDNNPLQNTSAMQLPETLKSVLLNRHIAMQAENTFIAEDKKKYADNESADTTLFYGGPTHSFNLDAYTRFNTIDEVMREITTDVKIRKKDNRNYLRVFNKPAQVYFDNDPLVLLDGVPVFDVEKIVSFSPLKIKTVNVVAAKFFTGPVENYGIISFTTYDGDLAGYNLDPGALVIKYDGVQLHRKFYSPVYIDEDAKKSSIPDLRNVLLWKPDILLNENHSTSCSFYTSGLKGTYAVVVQGLSQNGIPLSATHTFTVK